MCQWWDSSGCTLGLLDALPNFCINFTIKCILHIFFKTGLGIVNNSAGNPNTDSPHPRGPHWPLSHITSGGIALDAWFGIWMHFCINSQLNHFYIKKFNNYLSNIHAIIFQVYASHWRKCAQSCQCLNIFKITIFQLWGCPRTSQDIPVDLQAASLKNELKLNGQDIQGHYCTKVAFRPYANILRTPL